MVASEKYGAMQKYLRVFCNYCLAGAKGFWYISAICLLFLIKEFINSVDNAPRLKEFYNNKVTSLKEDLINLSSKVKDKAIQIKINEVVNILNPLNKVASVGDDNLINLLQYCELKEELQKANG